MRILLVSNYQPPHMGGIEFAAQSLKQCWIEDGHAVTWLTTDLPPGGAPQTPDNVRVSAANFFEDRWQINSPVVMPAAYRTIRRLAAEHDVVNIHSLAPGLSTAALRTAIRLNKPIVVTQHVGIIQLAFKPLSLLQETLLCSWARRCAREHIPLTFVGQAVRDWFLEHAGIPDTAVAMTPAGIDQHNYHFVPDDERTALRTKWKLEPDRLNVLFVGRFYEKKGLPLLQQVIARSPNLRFTLVGSGPIDAAAWNLPNMRILTFVSTAELRELYGSHDLFIMPSFGEGWPAVVPQAMACGLPCLISEETFQGYRQDADRFLVRPRDADALVGTLADAAAGKIPLIRERKALSDYARKHWDWKRTARTYLDLFKTAIARRK